MYTNEKMEDANHFHYRKTMKKKTIAEMIIDWLSDRRTGDIIASHHLQTEVVNYIKSWYRRTVLPATVEREFRRLRNQNSHSLKESGIELEPNGKVHGEHTWILKNNM